MLRGNFPGRKKSRIERALDSLQKTLALPTPPVQGGREPRDLNAYRERIKREIAHVENRLSKMVG